MTKHYGRLVACCVCGHQWHSDGPEVLYRSVDYRWWCRDEIACRRRHLNNLTLMQVALDKAWRALDKVAEGQQ